VRGSTRGAVDVGAPGAQNVVAHEKIAWRKRVVRRAGSATLNDAVTDPDAAAWVASVHGRRTYLFFWTSARDWARIRSPVDGARVPAGSVGDEGASPVPRESSVGADPELPWSAWRGAGGSKRDRHVPAGSSITPARARRVERAGWARIGDQHGRARCSAAFRSRGNVDEFVVPGRTRSARCSKRRRLSRRGSTIRGGRGSEERPARGRGAAAE